MMININVPKCQMYKAKMIMSMWFAWDVEGVSLDISHTSGMLYVRLEREGRGVDMLNITIRVDDCIPANLFDDAIKTIQEKVR